MTAALGLAVVQRRIAEAAARAGRDVADVAVVAASKTRSAEEILALHRKGGIAAFGENRVQEALPKIAELEGSGIRWHFIGRLQRNKVRDCGVFDLIHSVDSIPLADTIAARVPHVAVLAQVNTAGEARKGGVAPEDAEALVRHMLARGLNVRGLMVMAPLGDSDAARRCFAAAAGLRDTLAEGIGMGLPELSMGMTDDLEAAVEEGATLVRIGRALFGPRPP